MNFKDKVRQMVKKASSTKEETWQAFKTHSLDYAKALGLSGDDLSVLEREVQEALSTYPELEEVGAKGFLKFDLDGKKFSFAVKHVCGLHYDEEWHDFIFAICMSRTSLNQTIGYGTTMISVVPKDWHEKILRHIKNANRPKHLAVVRQLPKK